MFTEIPALAARGDYVLGPIWARGDARSPDTSRDRSPLPFSPLFERFPPFLLWTPRGSEAGGQGGDVGDCMVAVGLGGGADRGHCCQKTGGAAGAPHEKGNFGGKKAPIGPAGV